MTIEKSFWQLETLSDAQVLDGVDSLVRSGRRLTAELVAHLGEVEARRLHLRAAYGSMFSYCVSRCGLSEDEACRRIEVARLARKFPAIYQLLADGDLSLSVAALLKTRLTLENQAELFEAVRRKTVRQANEALAAIFPIPDAPSCVRKLPERGVNTVVDPASESGNKDKEAAPASNLNVGVEHARTRGDEMGDGAGRKGEADERRGDRPRLFPPSSNPEMQRGTLPVSEPKVAPAPPKIDAPRPTARSRIDPTSAERYRVQLTASRELKEKLELARDLCRHRNPSGDLAPIVEKALDLLIGKLMKEKFGVTDKPKRGRKARADRITNETKRAVLEKDGLQCAFVGEDGRRCEERAFIERDHVTPKGQGGGSGPNDVRHLCKAHNLLEAERAYGREKIQAEIEKRKGRGSKPFVIRDSAGSRSSLRQRYERRHSSMLARAKLEVRGGDPRYRGSTSIGIDSSPAARTAISAGA